MSNFNNTYNMSIIKKNNGTKRILQGEKKSFSKDTSYERKTLYVRTCTHS